MSKLLIEEPPLQVLPSLAVQYGLNEAIILQQLHWWAREERFGVEHEGRRWIFNSYEQWQKQFPFWSTRTIQRAFLNLEAQGAVLTFQRGGDRKKFYAVNYDRVDRVTIVPKWHGAGRQNGTLGGDKLARSSIAESTSKTTGARPARGKGKRNGTKNHSGQQSPTLAAAGL